MKVVALLPLVTMAQAITVGFWANKRGTGGSFQRFDTAPATCRNFIGNDAEWNDKISSLEIPPNVRCQFWDDINCQGLSLVVPASSSGWAANVPDNHDDKISSYVCYNA